jgi:hypothetical protein
MEQKKLSSKRQIKLYKKEVKKGVEPSLEKKIKLNDLEFIPQEITLSK